MVSMGPLGRRMLRRAGDVPSHTRLVELCQELCWCLHEGRLFEA
jgi:hypothetical protein